MALHDVEVLARPFDVPVRAPESRRRISRIVVVDLVRFSDALAIAAGGVAQFLLFSTSTTDYQGHQFSKHVAIVALGIVLGLTVLNLAKVYQFHDLSRLRYQVPRVTLAWSIALTLVVGAVYALDPRFRIEWIIGWWGLAVVGLVQSRLAWAYLVRRWARNGCVAKRVAVYGAGPPAGSVFDWLATQNVEEFIFAGVFDDHQHPQIGGALGRVQCGTLEDLITAARSGRVDEVIIALPPAAADQLRATIQVLRQLPIDVYWPLDLICGGVEAKGEVLVNGRSLLRLVRRPLSGRPALGKWLEDKLLGSLFLAVSSPLMLLIALLIKLESPGPVLFRQPRFGFNNTEIVVYKFRTMYQGQGDLTGAIQTTNRDPRVTRIGRLLRGFSLDELPQFINVLQGRLSIVGPRPHPLCMRVADRSYQEAVAEYAARHRVKPGITGWAQVNGLRGPTDTMDKAVRRVEHDLYYIDNWSVWFDLRVIFLTALRGFTDPNAL